MTQRWILAAAMACGMLVGSVALADDANSAGMQPSGAQTPAINDQNGQTPSGDMGNGSNYSGTAKPTPDMATPDAGATDQSAPVNNQPADQSGTTTPAPTNSGNPNP